MSETSASRDERSADAALVTRIRAGDADAFELLVARFQAPLFRYLHGLVGSHEQAQDLLQETFLRAYRALASLDDPALLRGWLYRIAHNQAVSVLRRRRLISWLPLHLSQPLAAPERGSIEALHVADALARVPVHQRAPLLLHLVGGFSYTEIAAMLGFSSLSAFSRWKRTALADQPRSV